MCSRQREQHVLHKALKHKRIWCGKKKRRSVRLEQGKLEKRHKMQGPDRKKL